MTTLRVVPTPTAAVNDACLDELEQTILAAYRGGWKRSRTALAIHLARRTSQVTAACRRLESWGYVLGTSRATCPPPTPPPTPDEIRAARDAIKLAEIGHLRTAPVPKREPDLKAKCHAYVIEWKRIKAGRPAPKRESVPGSGSGAGNPHRFRRVIDWGEE